MSSKWLTAALVTGAGCAALWLALWQAPRRQPAPSADGAPAQGDLVEAPAATPSPPAPSLPEQAEAPQELPGPAPRRERARDEPKVASARAVLELPDALRDAPEAEQRAYYQRLLHHHEVMIEAAREQLEELQAQSHPSEETRAEIEAKRRGIAEAEAQLRVLRDQLAPGGRTPVP